MNYSIYRSINSTFYVILISAILSILFAIKAFAKTTDNPDYYKNKFNEEVAGKEDRYWVNSQIKKRGKILYDPDLSALHHYTENGNTWKGLG